MKKQIATGTAAIACVTLSTVVWLRSAEVGIYLPSQRKPPQLPKLKLGQRKRRKLLLLMKLLFPKLIVEARWMAKDLAG